MDEESPKNPNSASGSMRTPLTLMQKLHIYPHDNEAWDRLDRLYGNKIHSWCRRWGLQEADCQEVSQRLMLKLVKGLRSFEYDREKSFRAWLKTAAHHILIDLIAESQRNGAHHQGDEQFWILVQHVEAVADLNSRLEEAYDKELLESALLLVQQEVTRSEWEAFRLLAVQKVAPSDASKTLNCKIVTLYAYKSRVLGEIKKIIQELESPNSLPADGAQIASAEKPKKQRKRPVKPAPENAAPVDPAAPETITDGGISDAWNGLDNPLQTPLDHPSDPPSRFR